MNTVISDIAVHLTGSEEDHVRITYAAALARLMGARLSGLHTHILPGLLEITDPSGSAFLQALISESVEDALKVTARLVDELAATGLPTEVRRLDLYPNEVGSALMQEVRASDLFVGTLPYGDKKGGDWIEEAVLFDAGRPCCFVPPGYTRPAALGHVVVAWNGSAGAARAMTAALPLLARAERVTVIAVVDSALPVAGSPFSALERYLRNHNLKAETKQVTTRGDAGEALISEIQAAEADVIVMGGYGHSRFREWLLGGVTRLLLSNSPVPVFMMH